MIYGCYFFISLILIVSKTVIIDYVPFARNFYDPLIALVLYLALFRPVRENIVVMIVLGVAMDTLSGGPFGIYLTTYFWLFAIVRYITRFLRFSNTLILPFVVAGGVLLENILFAGTIALSQWRWPLNAPELRSIMVQFAWALFTGPLILLAIDFVRRGWESWVGEIMAPDGADHR